MEFCLSIAEEEEVAGSQMRGIRRLRESGESQLFSSLK
jgi:hypothetical protein